ncbi:DUF7594 domain-containing protein [Myxococcus sp. Y35]|uniref:CBM96 family carbohydrate-binding protein n=1 Tax=Pseudomyxococcus flavus TaxID=3115648 RepID=UPI003CED56DD
MHRPRRRVAGPWSSGWTRRLSRRCTCVSMSRGWRSRFNARCCACTWERMERWGGPAVYATQGAWSETSVTWNTRPTQVGNKVDQLPFLAPLGYVDYEVTDLVRGNGEVTFGLYARPPVTGWSSTRGRLRARAVRSCWCGRAGSAVLRRMRA